jgi:hypothetical protein
MCADTQRDFVRIQLEYRRMLRKLSPASYVLALLAFFLPFLQVSCNNQKLVSLTGFQLVTGTQIQEPASGMFGGPVKTHRVGPVLAAVVAFVAGVLGLALSFVKGRPPAIASAVCAGASVICLLILPSQTGGAEARQQSMGMLQVEAEIGYYLAILFLAVAGVCVAVGEFAQTALSPPRPEARSTSAGASG